MEKKTSGDEIYYIQSSSSGSNTHAVSGGSGGAGNSLMGMTHITGHTFGGVGVATSGGEWHGGDGTGQALWPTMCRSGHLMGQEVVLGDGSVQGSCMVCGDVITGRRLAGGLVFEKLQQLVEGVLGGRSELAEQILASEQALELERQRLEDAERLLDLAKQLLVRG